MLIATLPTLTGSAAKRLSEEIIKHPLIKAVRYNTGGDSPYSPKEILETLKLIADCYKKPFWVDLEGRQIRVGRWNPYSRGAVTLNRDFTIELPAMIHFRRAGWFNVLNALAKERKIFFKPQKTRQEYYLGESQSVNIVAKNFEVQGGYLAGPDFEYIKAACELGISRFMLSFVESSSDISEFYRAYWAQGVGRALPPAQLILKIESQKGVKFVRKLSKKKLQKFHLMAARDDLFLSFMEKPIEVLNGLKLIVKKDPEAVLASRIMSGLERDGELSLGDMEDIVLMSQFGYKHFMLSDGLSDYFKQAMQDWQEIILPLLGKNWFSEKKRWKKK